MKVRKGNIVSLAYRVTTEDGRVVEQVLSDEPLSVVQGSGLLNEQIEKLTEGLSPGDSVSLQIQGRPTSRDTTHQCIRVPLDRLPQDFIPRIGVAVLSVCPPNTHVLWVREIHDDHVVLDPSDPLDELPLTVRVWILDVAKAV